MAELLELADDETAALWRDLGLGYTESLGHPLLRREIAALYEGIDPDEVVVFSGAEEAIFAVANVRARARATTRSSCGPRTRACTRSPGRPAPT